MSNTLSTLPKLAAEYIRVHGWTQGKIVTLVRQAATMTDALRECTPVPGDDILARGVLRRKGRGESWNDDPLRNEIEVTGYLDTVEITDADLEDTYGSQWRKIVTLVRQAATMTDDQEDRIGRAWDDTNVIPWNAARDAISPFETQAAANVAASATGAIGTARNAAMDAARALTTSESVGSNGLEQHHIDTLLHPWESVMGTIEETES